MDWSHVNMAEAIWSQPGHITKTRDAHRIFLPALAMEILTARHLAAGNPTTGLVFPAPRSGKVIDTFGDIKAALNAQLPQLADWRFHDLRRTFATASAHHLLAKQQTVSAESSMGVKGIWRK